MAAEVGPLESIPVLTEKQKSELEDTWYYARVYDLDRPILSLGNAAMKWADGRITRVSPDKIKTAEQIRQELAERFRIGGSLTDIKIGDRIMGVNAPHGFIEKYYGGVGGGSIYYYIFRVSRNGYVMKAII